MEYKYEYFNIKIVDKIAELSINRPEKSNAFNEKCWEELGSIFQSLSKDKHVRVIILFSKSKNFSAGMDLSTLMELPSRWANNCEAKKREEIRCFIKKIQDCISEIEKCVKPVIACVRGACIGGAMSIVTACDMVYCSDDAYFSIKELDLGIVPDIGVLQRLPLSIRPGIVAELAYTARNFSSNEALEFGLLNRSYSSPEKMMEEVRDISKLIASKSPLVIKGIKKMLLYKRDHSIQESLDYVSLWNSSMLISEDLTEAMTAYIAKKPAEFND